MAGCATLRRSIHGARGRPLTSGSEPFHLEGVPSASPKSSRFRAHSKMEPPHVSVFRNKGDFSVHKQLKMLLHPIDVDLVLACVASRLYQNVANAKIYVG